MEEIKYTITPSLLNEEQLVDFILGNICYQKVVNIIEEFEKQMRIKILNKGSDTNE